MILNLTIIQDLLAVVGMVVVVVVVLLFDVDQLINVR